MDFGIPGYEDKNITMDDYINRYIQKGVQQTLRHTGAEAVTLMGFCLGGTLTAIYGAMANEPIKNIILSGAPIDFTFDTSFSEWVSAFHQEKVDFDHFINTMGLIPASAMETGMRLLTSPIYYSPYLSLLNRAYDDEYRYKWSMMNSWTKGHIPLSGAFLKQILHDLVKENKLIKGELMIGEEKVNLSNIKASLLAVTTDSDQLVPKKHITPILELVSSEDVTFALETGGHANLTRNGELPGYLKDWLPQRSAPL